MKTRVLVLRSGKSQRHGLAARLVVVFQRAVEIVMHPDVTLRVRAARGEPDMFYVNRNLKLIENLLFE